VLKERVQHGGQLVSAIENVAQGSSMIDAKVVEALVGAQRRAEQSRLHELTPREIETSRSSRRDPATKASPTSSSSPSGRSRSTSTRSSSSSI